MSPRPLSDHEALRRIRPTTSAHRRSLLKLAACLVLILGIIPTLFFLKRRDLEDRERTWQSATAVIIDARPSLAMQVDSSRGGTMTYHVEVLVRYRAGNIPREQWTVISGQPELLPDTQLKANLLKGKTCTVHWRPARPLQLFAEIS
jgi:hypothetical protein